MKNAETTEKIAGMSDAAVRAKTGKGWSEWFKILDAAGARKMEHRDIANYLHKHHNVPGWWDQMITVGYEQARGRREKRQKPSGLRNQQQQDHLRCPACVI